MTTNQLQSKYITLSLSHFIEGKQSIEG